MYISIDLGGTNTRIASSDNLTDIKEIEKVPTEQNIALEKKILQEAIEKLSQDSKIKGICFGIPGLVDKESKKLKIVPHIPSFNGAHFSELFGEEIDQDILLAENDAALAGLGEAVRGAGSKHNVVAYLTLSTGVGGIRITGKKLDQFRNQSEPGHMIIESEGRYAKPCHQHGCLESYISGTAFRQVYGVRPSECEDQQIWDDYAGKLALGVINVLAMWGPDVVVLGGSISNKFEPFFKESLLTKLSQQEFFAIPPIIKSALGDNSGLYGGFILLEQTLNR